MLFPIRSKVPKLVYFSDPSGFYIRSHSVSAGVTTFHYEIQIKVDKSIINLLRGELQFRVFSSKKTPNPIELKLTDVLSGNVSKKIDRQKSLQVKDRNLLKKFIVKKSIDRPDLGQDVIPFQFDINSSQISENFFIELANLRPDGSTSVIDSTVVNHSTILQKYDLPSEDFSLTVSRRGKYDICVSASTEDSCVGSFLFFVQNDSSNTFAQRKNSSSFRVSNIEKGGISNALFSFDDNQAPFTVRACPISVFLKQQIGNFKELKDEFDYEEKQIPFYVSGFDDTRLSFSIVCPEKSVKKVFLYRQGFFELEKTLAGSATINQSGALISDIERNPQYDYSYTIEYLDSNGLIKSCPNEVIVLAQKLDKLAKIKVDLLKNDSDMVKQAQQVSASSQVYFNATVEYNTETIFDQILEDIKDLGIENLISEDLKKTTNNIKPLVRVIVTRISLVTGVEEHVGIFKPGMIAVERPDDSYIFRFEVAVRSIPETLESLTAAQRLISENSYNLKSLSDLSTKIIGNRAKTSGKNFSSKFYSRSSIRNSTLSYGDSASLSDIGYFSGRTGIFSDYVLSREKEISPGVKNIQILKTQKGFYVKWNFSGNYQTVNYFEITTDLGVFNSHPISRPTQIFYVGKTMPAEFSVLPVLKNSTSNTEKPGAS